MKRSIRFILAVLIALSFFGVFYQSSKMVDAITQDADGNWYWGYESRLDEDYYSALDGITNANEFEKTLANILASGAVRFSYGYKDNNTGDHLAYIDEDPNNTSNVLCMYTGRSISKGASHSSSGGWNQEHTWAKSHGFPENGYSSTYPYCDLNHLRATECNINSTRGNLDFGEVSGGSSSYGCSWGGGYFEPRDCVKGDVARIMMYMDVRYNGTSANTSNITLTLVEGTTSSSAGSGKFGDLSTLLEWHEQDPVDDLERRRNDRVYDIQGNRNPFIDRPEYANIIYGTNYETEDEDQTYTVTYNVANGVTFNYVDNNQYKKGDRIDEPQVEPIKAGYEFAGWYSDQALTQVWNFNSNTITKNLTLYPKFTVILTATDSFALLTTQAKMKVNANVVGDGSVESKSVVLSSFSGNGTVNGTTKNQVVDLSDYISFDESLFGMAFHTNNNQYCYVGGKDKELRLYPGNNTTNGSSVVITAKGSLVIDDVKTNNSNVKVTIASDGKTATIQNTSTATSGNEKVRSITINYSTSSVSYEVLSSKLAYRYEVNNALLSKLRDLDADLKFGFKIGNKHVEAELVNGILTYDYVSVSLTENFNVCGYVLINGQYYYTKAQNYSIKTLASRYLSEMPKDSIVAENKGLLTFLSK